MFYRYINLRLRVKETARSLPKHERPAYFAHIRKFKSYATFETHPEPDETLSDIEWQILDEMWSIFPEYDRTKGLAYSVVSNSSSFFPAYCELASLFELHELPLFSAIPLRKSHIQCNAFIDTRILCHHVLGISRQSLSPEKKLELYGKAFNTDNKVFKSRSQMVFDGSISTDGISLSVHLEDPRAPVFTPKKSKEALQREIDELYFENHLEELKDAENIVVIDPGKRDILYCRDTNTHQNMRYTSNQRLKETGVRLYNKKRQVMKDESHITTIESATPTHKTMDLKRYIAYLHYREETRPALQPFYQNPIHNKWRLKTYINTQRSEAQLLNRMKDKYGNDFSVIFGDWSDAGRTMKFQVSTKTKGWREFFRRNHIKCYLIDEYKTSSRCPDCEEEVDYVRERLSPRPHRAAKGQIDRVHGLLGCTSFQCCKQSWTLENGRRYRYWNRDQLGVSNFINIVTASILDRSRPSYLCR